MIISAISIGKNIFALATIVFAFLSIMSPEDWFLRITTQFTAFFLTLLNGLYTILYLRNRSLGYFLIGASAFVLVALIFTLFVAFRLGVF